MNVINPIRRIPNWTCRQVVIYHDLPKLGVPQSHHNPLDPWAPAHTVKNGRQDRQYHETGEEHAWGPIG